MIKPALILFGTPEFAIVPFEALAATGDYDIRAVVTQPDKPAGRGNKLTAPPVKVWAEARGLRVLQPASVKHLLVEMRPDPARQTLAPHVVPMKEDLFELAEILSTGVSTGIAVAYGKIIPPQLIEACAGRIVNIHPSILPRWRGAAPVQHTVFNGDAETGVALMSIDAGVDTGPVYSLERLPVPADATTGSLSQVLAAHGATMLVRDLPAILRGELEPVQQPEEGATYADKWEIDDCTINWSEAAETIERRVRASAPDPGARTTIDSEILKLFRTHVVRSPDPSAEAGTVIAVSGDAITVQTGTPGRALALDEIQFAGKRRMAAGEVLRGRQVAVGTKLG